MGGGGLYFCYILIIFLVSCACTGGVLTLIRGFFFKYFLFKSGVELFFYTLP